MRTYLIMLPRSDHSGQSTSLKRDVFDAELLKLAGGYSMSGPNSWRSAWRDEKVVTTLLNGKTSEETTAIPKNEGVEARIVSLDDRSKLEEIFFSTFPEEQSVAITEIGTTEISYRSDKVETRRHAT
jgi:hypothetical protein